MHIHTVSPSPIGTGIPERVINGEIRLELSEESRQLIDQCRKYLDKKVRNSSDLIYGCLLYTSPSPRDRTRSRMPSSA